MLWALKYRGDVEAVRVCAALLYDTIVHELSERFEFHLIEKPIVIPVPLSRTRLRERGFNQCALLALELERTDQQRFFTVDCRVIEKWRDTAPQTTQKDRGEREKNLKDCFRVLDSEKIKNKDIIVIDDVLTTGSTLKEMRTTLLAAGAKSVLSFTIAH